MGPLGFVIAVLLYFVLFKASELLLGCGSWFVYTDFWFNNILDENLTFMFTPCPLKALSWTLTLPLVSLFLCARKNLCLIAKINNGSER